MQLEEQLSTFAPVPVVEVPDMTAWDRETFGKRRFLVAQLESHLQTMGVPTEHPFRGSAKQRYLPAEKARIEAAAEEATQALETYEAATGRLSDLLHRTPPEDPHDATTLLRLAERVAEAPDLTGITCDAPAWLERRDAVQGLLDTGQQYHALDERFGDVLIPEAWDEDVMPLRKALAAYGTRWYRWLIGDWRRATNELKGLCQTALPKGADKRLALVDAVLEAQRLAADLSDRDALGSALFGERWKGADSRWPDLLAAGRLLLQVHREMQDGTLPPNAIEALAQPPAVRELTAAREEVARTAGELQEATADVLGLLEIPRRLESDPSKDENEEDASAEGDVNDDRVLVSDRELTPSPERPFAEQAAFFEACRAEAPRIQEMITYNHLTGDLTEAGLRSVLAVAHTWPHGAGHLSALFRYAYLNALLERAMDERPALEDFSGGQHERVVEKFKRLDRKLLTYNRHRLALRHHKNKPRRTGAGQVGVLLHECGKQRAHMPLRSLLQRAGEAVQALKPVFMMSPLSVPKYLPPGGLSFDLVVFDEASQVRPVEAFGSILRGDQTVVVGDSKQLPPTDFFSAMGGGDDTNGYEMRAGDQESVLDLFRSKGASERMLRFHYRSRHESLIAVSNREFYNDRLYVFPSPDAERGGKGLVYRHLPDTVYERGGSRTNPKEARAVAEAVMTHARATPDLSLGVATFSTAQMDAIQQELEVLRQADPSCESFFGGHPTEPFFVKNLETVQGDQRDVMFISVGYGRDQHGRVTMNFGPLNRDGGERRLNVLTTRAKLRCEVFTNLRAEDIDLSRTNARGVEVLKTYLDFAATGEMDLPEVTGKGPDSPFEEAVADALRAEGHRVVYQVGVAGFYIDLAVIDPQQPGRYVLGIECDGASYHSSHMARVRDRSRQAVLESLGWTIHRIWSTDWFRNPEEQLARATAAIERAKLGAEGNHPPPTDEGPDEPSVASVSDEPAPEAAAEGDPEPPAVDERADEVIGRAPTVIEREEPEEMAPAVETEPYAAAEMHIYLLGNDFHETPPRQIAQWLVEVVAVESPVHREVAGRRLLEAAGVSRMGRRIKRALKRGEQRAARDGTIVVKGDVLRHPEQNTPLVRDRSEADEYARQTEHLPPEEISAAATAIARQAFSISREELIAETARALGYGRVGSKLKRVIGETVDGLIAQEILQTDGEEVYRVD